VAAITAFGQTGQNRVAQPGAVNYLEGSVSIDGRMLTHDAIGTAQVEQGQVLATAQGKAEMLLTPGIFVRLDDNSSVKMLSNSLTNTQVQLQNGRALVEVDMIAPENRVTIVDNGYPTQLQKKGIYRFDADSPSVAVYDGKAAVRVNDRNIELGKGRQLTLTGEVAHLKPQKFDTKHSSDLYAWSKLRSEYMAEANASSAQTIYAYNPGWWYGTGWYWNPWFGSWAFVPGGGYLYSPFGFGFFSPTYVYSYAPVYRGFGYRGFGNPGVIGRRGGFAVSPGPGFGRSGGFHAVAPAGGAGVHFGGIGRR
jgi:hypothetical protein